MIGGLVPGHEMDERFLAGLDSRYTGRDIKAPKSRGRGWRSLEGSGAREHRLEIRLDEHLEQGHGRYSMMLRALQGKLRHVLVVQKQALRDGLHSCERLPFGVVSEAKDMSYTLIRSVVVWTPYNSIWSCRNK